MRRLFTLACLTTIGFTATSQVISTFPYFQDFEGESQGPTTCGAVYNMLSLGWENDDMDDTDWTADLNGTTSSSTGPSGDHTTGSGIYMYVETSTCYNNTANLHSPWFDFTALSYPGLKYWAHMYGVDINELHLDVRTGLNNPWDLDVVPFITDNQDLWQEQIVPLFAYLAEDSVQIRFRYITGSSFAGDLAIDDVTVLEFPAFDLAATDVDGPVSGCSATGANEQITLTLDYLGGATLTTGSMVPVAYQINALPAVTETITLLSDLNYGDQLFYTFTTTADLSATGQYVITSYSDLVTDGNHSNDTTSLVVDNIPTIDTYPYFEDFESGTGFWAVDPISANSTWEFGTPAKAVIQGASSGVNAWTTGGLTGIYVANEESYLLGPCFDMTSLTNPWIRLDIWVESEFSWDGAKLEYSIDGGTTWLPVGALGDAFNWYNDGSISGLSHTTNQEGWTGRNGSGTNGWVTARHDLSPLAGEGDVKLRIAFGTDGSVNDDGFAVDNIYIGEPIQVDLGMDFSECESQNGPGALVTATPSVGEYEWNTGDDTSFTHINIPGLNSISVIYFDTNGLVSYDTVIVEIFALPAFALGNDTTICSPATLDLDAMNAGSTYLWNTGETTQMITVDTSAIYTVDITNADGCTLVDSIDVLAVGTIVVDLGLDRWICVGDDVTLTANISGADSYLWSTGATTQSIVVSTPDTIWVEVDKCNVDRDTVIVANSIPMVDLGMDTTECALVTLDAGAPFDMYDWSNGETTQTIDVTMSGTYSVTVTDSVGCTEMDDVMVTILPLPLVGLGPDQTICNGSTITLNGGFGYSSYSWSDGATGQFNTVNPTDDATTDYILTVTDANMCANSDTISITSEECIGLEENQLASFTMYPNPSSDKVYLHVTSTEAKVSITSVLGQVVAQVELGVNGDAVVDMSAQAPGVYLVQVTIGNTSRTEKLIVR